MEIRFTVTDASLADGLRRALASAQDLTPAMREIAGALETYTQERFETGRDPDGRAWPPSARVASGDGRTLVDSGALLRSITAAHSATRAAAGTNLVYAAIHQFGGTVRPRKGRALKTPFGYRASVRMPARPFLGFGAAERDAIGDILSAHLARAFGGAA